MRGVQGSDRMNGETKRDKRDGGEVCEAGDTRTTSRVFYDDEGHTLLMRGHRLQVPSNQLKTAEHSKHTSWWRQ